MGGGIEDELWAGGEEIGEAEVEAGVVGVFEKVVGEEAELFGGGWGDGRGDGGGGEILALGEEGGGGGGEVLFVELFQGLDGRV